MTTDVYMINVALPFFIRKLTDAVLRMETFLLRDREFLLFCTK